MQKKSNLYVFTKAKDLAKYIITITEKSPKKYRFTLVVRIQNYILDVIENIYLANESKDIKERIARQEKAKTLLSMLDYFCQIAEEQECISFHQYEQISKQQAECLLYLKRWMAATIKQVSTEESDDIGES